MKNETNYDKLYLSDKDFWDQINKADELSLKLIDESPRDKCVNCNAIVDIKKADRIIADFIGGRGKDFPSGTITDYFCPGCESLLYGYTEIRSNNG